MPDFSLPSEAEFRARQDFETLMEAERIRADEARLRQATQIADQERSALAGVEAMDPPPKRFNGGNRRLAVKRKGRGTKMSSGGDTTIRLGKNV